MAERQLSIASNRSTRRKPPVRPKPSHLEEAVLEINDKDYLNDNLLGGIEDDLSSLHLPAEEPPKPPMPLSLPSHLKRSGTLDLGRNRLVIAIDYGTTFTGVAFATPKSEDARLEDIEIVDNWGPKMGNHNKIPSVYSYSPASPAGEQQWGASLSPEAVTMVNTKMELDVQDNKLDELQLILQMLDGTSNLDFENVKQSRGYPEYTWKNPEEIVTDYLTKIFQYLNQAFEYFGQHLRGQIPVDIVITVPVKWSYRAKNSTLRAIRKAGFNEETYPNLKDIIMVTEPEAAAIYTARYLKEDKKKEFLKLGECFVLCDAGGGTVDVVSYKVTQLEPTLELEEMSIATSARCGSAYIDANFKRWLQKVIGERNYRALDPKSAGQQISANTMEGKQMRLVMKAFDARKKVFANHAPEMKLDLPKPLDKLNIPGRVVEGELRITFAEMRELFDPCVNNVIELIQGQIQQVERKKNRVKNMFLVGGFGESPFLQDELELSLKLRGITMRRPATAKAWTAVVQGAVIYGIEKARRHNNVTFMSTCSKSYGIVLNEEYSASRFDSKTKYIDPITDRVMANDQITWLIQRGDLLLSDTKTETEKEFLFRFVETNDRKFKLPVYEYPDEDDDKPDWFETGQNDVLEVATLNCDLSSFPLADFDLFENPKTKRPYYSTYLTCKMLVTGMTLEVEIHWNKRKLCSTKIKDVECARPRNFNPAEPPSYDEDFSFRRSSPPMKAAPFMAELDGDSMDIYGEA